MKKKVLFILSRILGGKTYSNRLVSCIAAFPHIEPTYLFFDYSDYQYPNIPFMCKKTGKFVSANVVRERYKREISGEFDGLFVQSFELILMLGDLIKKTPTILAHDSTNVLGHWLVYNLSPSYYNFISYKVKSLITKKMYGSVVKNIDVFMPRTSWCADSLLKDYGVPQDRIIVSCGGIDTKIWSPKKQSVDNCTKKNLIFVGNDFERKGGSLLLELYSKHLSGECLLKIVSNDEVISSYSLPEGVSVVRGINHRNIHELIELYQQADIFIYPTRKDQLGLVLMEAAAAGLPIIATELAGIPDLVEDGVNGYLMPYDCDVDQWAERVKYLLHNKNKIIEFSRASMLLADRDFSLPVFKRKLEDAFRKTEII